MKKLILFFIVLILFIMGVMAGPVDDKSDILVKLNFYEGLKGDEVKGESVVSTYFLKPLFVGKIHIEGSEKNESAEIKKIFNLSGINLMSEAKWGWRRGEKKKEFQLLILNGHEFMIEIMMKELPDNFIVMVSNRQNKKVLLKTDIILPEKRSSVFGFEDSRGKPFFLSLSRAMGESVLRKESPVEKIVSVKNPVLIKKVKPVYPKEALRRKVSGEVLMEAVCDVYGKVVEVKILRGEPLLNSAAVNAVKRWVYEPYIINKVVKPVKFTVIMKFRLDGGKKKTIKKTKTTKDLVFLKGKSPEYPEVAKKARVSDTVSIKATINEKGNVTNVQVLRGHPLLTGPSRESVMTWKFKPVLENGKPVKKDINIKVKFLPDFKVKTYKSIVYEDTGIPNIWPARGYLTWVFGERVDKKTKKKFFHKGVDIAAKEKSKIIAPANGIVTFAASKGKHGNLIIIDHQNNYISKYAHLYSMKVKAGDKVKKGDVIGLVGSTGQSNGSHLHW
ncbi:MAG: TonB family protein, partial [Candidatus Aminicenantes bacterium]|nr:TonB family protein [Candidatus Aminicenantes bacterium]